MPRAPTVAVKPARKIVVPKPRKTEPPKPGGARMTLKTHVKS